MKNISMFNNMTRSLNKVGFKLKKYSPEILVTAGVVGVVASAVMACKSSMKLNDVLNESKEQVDKIHNYVDEHGFTEKYSEEDSKKDLTIVHTQTAFKIVKLYAPAVILGSLSIAAILTSNSIHRKRNVALIAAYGTLDKSFKEYRERVVDRFGKELDYELKHNIKAEEIEETVVDEKGKEKTVKKTVNTVDPNDISVHARFFDVGNPNWEKDAEHNLFFLKQQQNYLNERLKAKGHLFLNDAYEALGIPKCQAGQVVGWIYDPKNPNHKGDNFIDFGIYSLNEANQLFVNGQERTILLDPNVDGPIWDKI